MRPQQQNRRMRGRNNNNNNNNRKGPNPLTRNYESNGPDVKIRGSAQQIAEKYATLARDAMSSGDRVMAENYLQHAEHYNRIIAAAQAQMPIQHQQQSRDEFDDDMDDGDDFDNAGGAAHSGEAANGTGPQPVIEGTPAEVALGEGGRDSNGGNRHHRDRRHNNGNYQNGQRNEYQPRGERGNDRRQEASAPAPVEAAAAPAAVEAAPPSFASLSPSDIVAQVSSSQAGSQAGAEEAPRRPRRPRRPRNAGSEGGAEASASDQGDIAAEAPATAEG